MTGDDLVWAAGRVWIGLPFRVLTRARFYGVERIPAEGGIVVASNHFSWVDPPLVGAACPRRIQFVAKIEAHRAPGLGQLIRAHGTLPIRRGESDREAVRKMREAVREGGALGLFVEGTRQRSGVPGRVQPGAAMVALQEGVPVVPVALHGTQHWRPWKLAPCSLVWGEPLRFDGLPRGGRGYREASVEIERELRRLWEWLVEIHAQGRPRAVTLP
ncbi:MAG TPA: lysophospholipid acyltransferase family protein [Gaiellaceae bacterium]|nr:lysophospholipid acyltransferase family protein [Gaiellaceae bacterium]